MASEHIIIRGAREHNLKNVSLEIPRSKLITITGLSGSGKSSLAFDTLYAEGQRRYVESLSAYARQFLEQMKKPDVDLIEGLSPAIAIEQHLSASNPRSIIATTTEIYDYLRLLFVHLGQPHCTQCDRPLENFTTSQIIDEILKFPAESRIILLAPVIRGKKGQFKDILEKVRRQGFVRVRVNGEILDLSEKINLDPKRKHDIEVVVDRLVINESVRTRLADSVETALEWGEGMILLLFQEQGSTASAWKQCLLTKKYACKVHGIQSIEMSPQFFSFNSPHGACPDCDGLGTRMEWDESLIIPEPEKSLADGAIVPWRRGGAALQNHYEQLLQGFCSHFKVDPEIPFKNLPVEIKHKLLHGTGDEKLSFTMERKEEKHQYEKPFEGVIPNLSRRIQESENPLARRRYEEFMARLPCPKCKGARLRPEALAVTIQGKSISQVISQSVGDAFRFLEALTLNSTQEKILRDVLREIGNRLRFLVDVGLHYLTLDRESGTLSGGESQRIRLATQIGAGLVGVLYILDEPSIGLHQRDNEKLLQTLERLRDLGNTVIVVEHDEDTIRRSDYIIDLGPGAGVNGGHIVAQGRLKDILEAKKSLTARYLKGEIQIQVPKERHLPGKNWLEIRGARENNLKNINVRIPLELFTCITGVSGSGKSTLVHEILCKALSRKLYRSKVRPGDHNDILHSEEIDKLIVIDQSPIGRTPRSNPATYTGIFALVRDLFAELPASKVRGYGPGRFSFNVPGGRCEDCLGDGIKKIEMHFLPDVYVRCETCNGKRYNRETLEITYKGRNIADILDMNVDEAVHFFRSIPQIYEKLTTLQDVGLGYVALGQQGTTLSGGESQRVKLASELSKHFTGRTLYILDEPTTGLHFADIHKLLEVLTKLRNAGNTILIIEHNLDVIKTADWIIDLGPEGGSDGGQIVAQGTPEEISRTEHSHTGRFLRNVLRTV